MLNIKVICVGKVKEKSSKELIAEYSKRISKFAKLEIIELEDEKLLLNPSNNEIDKIKNIESQKIKEKLNKLGKCTTFFLDLNGEEYTSIEFANKINELSVYGSSTICFVIGGSLGMTKELLDTADKKICFSKMTFPHQLIRIFLLEQIFRSFKILNNETYHH